MAHSTVLKPIREMGSKGADMAAETSKRAANGTKGLLRSIGKRFVQDKKQKVYFNLHVRVFAALCGIVWGIGLFSAAWWVILMEGRKKAAKERLPMHRVYVGYSATPLGAVMGLLWGMADGFFCGAAFAWAYNKLTSLGGRRIEIQV